MSEKRESALHTGHRQRVKNKFKEFGTDAFEEHELLEFLLFFGIPYKDTNELAHRLINKFGRFCEVFDANIEDLKDIEGMTDNAAVLIKALPGIANRYRQSKLKNTTSINCLRDCIEYLKNMLTDLTVEQFLMISLDTKGSIIRCSKLNKGSVNSVHIDIRGVHEQAIRDRAANVILAHNHPAHTIGPSKEDVLVTQDIISSLAFLEINVYDHIIISGDNYFSFRHEGIIDSLQQKCPQYFLAKFAESNEKWLQE